jgi:hypothetical protein
MKMVAAIYAKMLGQFQYVTWINPESQSYTLKMITDQGCKT